MSEASTVARSEEGYRSADAVAGLLGSASVVLSAIAMGGGLLLSVEAYPARTAPAAIVLALVAARMSARFQRLALKATLFAALAFVVGMTVAVVTESPLF